MNRNEEIDSKRVEEFLSPLASVRPVTLARPRAVRRRRRLVLVIASALALSGAAAVAADEIFNPHDATVEIAPNPLTCAGLIGKPAEDAAAYFAARGYEVSWRFDTFGGKVGTPTAGGVVAVTGGQAAEESSPRPGSVVWDILPLGQDPKRVVVRTRSPDDPNAPHVEPPRNC